MITTIDDIIGYLLHIRFGPELTDLCSGQGQARCFAGALLSGRRWLMSDGIGYLPYVNVRMTVLHDILLDISYSVSPSHCLNADMCKI